MVAWWQRLFFSLASLVTAALLCLGCLVLETVAKSRAGSVQSSEVMLVAGLTVGFCMVAWVVSAPVVLTIRNIRGVRFWLYWVLGSCVGPVVMAGLCAVVYFMFPHSPGSPWFRPEYLPLMGLAGAISSLTALLYLLMLRSAQKRATRKVSEG
jgi:hypothetical protein